ncbi:hypothetical protein [Hyphomicrobium sp. D-2]|uniref:hypothetical protein n=1 Tax=Hyphomicrobium sp. D-2 TaxID=3041621 RepID=UPI002457A118|nr:hypothetical protein [Hyphomicrobium sp. D-2]MDH4983027.1 hypothetical protein [Hyphomicrobium sp. D-2]
MSTDRLVGYQRRRPAGEHHCGCAVVAQQPYTNSTTLFAIDINLPLNLPPRAVARLAALDNLLQLRLAGRFSAAARRNLRSGNISATFEVRTCSSALVICRLRAGDLRCGGQQTLCVSATAPCRE